jgi:hypothetical protein
LFVFSAMQLSCKVDRLSRKVIRCQGESFNGRNRSAGRWNMGALQSARYCDIGSFPLFHGFSCHPTFDLAAPRAKGQTKLLSRLDRAIDQMPKTATIRADSIAKLNIFSLSIEQLKVIRPTVDRFSISLANKRRFHLRLIRILSAVC